MIFLSIGFCCLRQQYNANLPLVKHLLKNIYKISTSYIVLYGLLTSLYIIIPMRK